MKISQLEAVRIPIFRSVKIYVWAVISPSQGEIEHKPLEAYAAQKMASKGLCSKVNSREWSVANVGIGRVDMFRFCTSGYSDFGV